MNKLKFHYVRGLEDSRGCVFLTNFWSLAALFEMTSISYLVPLFATCVFLPSLLSAQAPGVPIVEQSTQGLDREDQKIHLQIAAFAKDDKLLSTEEIKTQLKAPLEKKITLMSPSEKELKPADIADRARASIYRVGIAYLCGKCDKWHTNFGAGYAITKDGVLATCAHCLELEPDLETQTIVAVDMEGKVYPATKIIANHEKMDAALIKIDVETTALPLNHNVRQGEVAYCLSRPLDQRQYFSTGIINRFYWRTPKRGKDDTALRALAQLRVNVSTDWAPGSSGAPVLDRFGNVICHVSEIEPIAEELVIGMDGKSQPVPLVMLHTGIPAKAVDALAKSLKSKPEPTKVD